MARISKNKPVKKAIYVFWEGESEEAYSKFLKEEFEEYAIIKCHREKGTFLTAKSYYRNNRRFKSDVEELDEIWLFFDTEIEMGDQWDEKMKCLKDIIKSRPRNNPLKIRLLMTTGCIEYWLLLHFKKTAPSIATSADKEKILNEVRKIEPTYIKGDYTSIENIAKHYLAAVENGQWTLERLKDDGLPEDEQQRNQWLFRGEHTFTTVHEALLMLMELSKE
ncbi:RloB family protein [Ruminococcus sp.]|uniref:RloB family protein n=1 Tax=Ruminococcus sp. TaxID=41978 RepID=UPI002608C757|nr:RloB family protein [Ruminococcus sp.]MDD6988358.1 RloB family protein [Ruminococcus sp.]MDY6201994.1 RloB family protein [Ruminococcus sp.]